MAKLDIIGSGIDLHARRAHGLRGKGDRLRADGDAADAPELRAIHPFGKMPVLRHGDVELCESKAIATYLDRSFPGPSIFPSDPHLGAHRAMGLARQHGDRPHSDPHLSLRLYRPEDRRRRA